jgi:hypothetical protein
VVPPPSNWTRRKVMPWIPMFREEILISPKISAINFPGRRTRLRGPVLTLPHWPQLPMVEIS